MGLFDIDEAIPESLTDGGAPDPDEIDWGPQQEPLGDGEDCPECGYAYDSDEWEMTTHIDNPGVAGESWHYTCPNCEQETCVVGT